MDEQTGIADHRPQISAARVAEVVEDTYGLTGQLHSLPSDKDQNFVLRTNGGSSYIVKISHALESRDLLEAQHAILDRLRSAYVPVQEVVRASGASVTAIVDAGRSHLLRILTYLEGVPLANVRPHSHGLIASIGSYLAHLDLALDGFDHPALHRAYAWDIARAEETIDEFESHLADSRERTLVDHFRRQHARIVEPKIGTLRTGIIHSDANDFNVIVSPPERAERRIVGVIDFGDAIHTWLAAEPAIAAAYTALDKPNPLTTAATLVGAYHRKCPLLEEEIAVLHTLIGLRLSVSICMSAYQRKLEPENDYLVVSRKPAIRLLDHWSQIHPRLAEYVFRSACGLEPCPRSKGLVSWLRTNRQDFRPVVDSRTEPIVFDFSVGSKDWSFKELAEPGFAAEQIGQRMADADADVGVGRYDEVRLVYRGDQFAVGDERRTVHVGLDLFQPPGSIVRAPLGGTVHSFADNDRPYDYGPTLILEHRPANGPVFYTLYGHLSRESLNRVSRGMEVAGGDPIGEIGDMHENGGWAPHLHFQLISDLLDHDGDFPGVAAPSTREVWLSLSPDPRLVVGDIKGATAPRTADLRDRRRRRIGPSLSIAYREPIEVERGHMQYLYDSDGRSYLDTVNNVAHVGHCHPRVVDAVARNMRTLNTNTRYLYEELLWYAERLAKTLPDPLEICYVVNSGSEANDLALRMARTFTGHRDVVVVDHAYHGNLSSLIEISPYKFNGPGGAGRPASTHVVPMPDPLRSSGGAAEGVAAIEGAPSPVAALFAESIMSCGGQVFYPDGYLQALFEAARKLGGVAIADEVQTGFGRVGGSFWAFELQGVIPDIVTMGKSIGNGYPLAAVVTTSEIAESFDNGMEYFNTFGGNPIACSAGLAVLDVLQEEGLQANARKVGSHFMERLRALADRHAVIGDVRGAGLFIGVELVRGRETNIPADAETAYVVERLREKEILASVDGPYRNVLKIKPPLVFDAPNADTYVSALDDVLTEDFVRARLQ